MSIRILNSEIAFKAFHTLRRVGFSWISRNGEVRQATHEVLERRDASAVLLHEIDGERLVLVRQYRLAAALNDHREPMLEVAAGLIDNGETPMETALREAAEETGYRPRIARAVMEIYPSPGVVTEKLYLFYAAVSVADRIDDGGGLAGESEETEVVFIPVKDVAAMLDGGNVRDAKTAILLHWFERHRLAGLL